MRGKNSLYHGVARGDDAMIHDLNLGRQMHGAESAPVRIFVAGGTEIPARLRLLGYDGCEFETKSRLKVGEAISVHIYRMGSIRARVIAQHSGIVEAEFIHNSPV